MSPEPKPRSGRATVTPVPLKLLAAVGALLVVPGGAFLVAANIGTGGKVAIGVAVTWWLVASAVIGRTALRRRPDLRTPVRATLAAAAVVSIVGFFVLTRDEEVGERIATGSDPAAASAQEPDAPVPAGERQPDRAEPKRNVQTLAGGFSGASGHSGTGKAAVVELAEGGRRPDPDAAHPRGAQEDRPPAQERLCERPTSGTTCPGRAGVPPPCRRDARALIKLALA